MKKVALFDWDKTVRKGGYVLFDFMDILVKDNTIDRSIVGEIDSILKQHAEGSLTYTEFAKEAIQIYRKPY